MLPYGFPNQQIEELEAAVTELMEWAKERGIELRQERNIPAPKSPNIDHLLRADLREALRPGFISFQVTND